MSVSETASEPVTVSEVMSMEDILRYAKANAGQRAGDGRLVGETDVTQYLLSMLVFELQSANVTLERCAKLLEWTK
jgi:hypothetical protein